MKATYQKERREYLKAHGICIRCGYRQAISGMVLCSDCREKNNKSRIGKKNKPLTDEQKIWQHELNKQKYHLRKEQGLCTYCGKNPALPGMTKCHECRLYLNQLRSGYFEHTPKYVRNEINAGRL